MLCFNWSITRSIGRYGVVVVVWWSSLPNPKPLLKSHFWQIKWKRAYSCHRLIGRSSCFQMLTSGRLSELLLTHNILLLSKVEVEMFRLGWRLTTTRLRLYYYVAEWMHRVLSWEDMKLYWLRLYPPEKE